MLSEYLQINVYKYVYISYIRVFEKFHNEISKNDLRVRFNVKKTDGELIF
ncbi:hypothetical protein LMANV2_470069 [Leptospira interrogans serovar Manilae]|uniref:Uncharacterized protein n=1 Tax=Leptospira interrogans serovar Manilae TaxID=214675 RepID=A0AAQ1P042_LEPIR|nr:hypothetical protein LMANV2_470069 [Leptospira interrogans serovar Manilae]